MAPLAPRLGHLRRPFAAAFGGGDGMKKKKLGRLRRPMFRVPPAPIVLKIPQGHEDSEFVLIFEIG